jgi:hypothetical protein
MAGPGDFDLIDGYPNEPVVITAEENVTISVAVGRGWTELVGAHRYATGEQIDVAGLEMVLRRLLAMSRELEPDG